MSECAICLDELIGRIGVSLTCRHIFHSVCLRKWLDYSQICPLCRAPMGEFAPTPLVLNRELMKQLDQEGIVLFYA
jgi:hypothetical protein